MLTAQLETIADSLDQLKQLFPIHWKELALNQDKVPLDPKYDEYLVREANGQLFYATIRENSKIVGYFVGFISQSLHYDMLCCMPDIFYVHPDKRGAELGTMLFQFVKVELKKRGVQHWVIGDKNHKPAGAFFEMLGFKKTENYYAMWLGD